MQQKLVKPVKNYDKAISIRCDSKMTEALDYLAKHYDASKSRVARLVLEREIHKWVNAVKKKDNISETLFD